VAAVATEAGDKPEPGPRRGRRALAWLGEHVAGAVVGTIVSLGIGAGVAWIATRDEDGASVADQIDDVRASLSGARLVPRHRELRLHEGGPSHLFVANTPATGATREIRIYDEVDGSLEERLSLRPRVREAPRAFSFHTERVADLNGDGQREIVASYEHNPAGVEYVRIPLLIARDSGSGAYRTAAILAPERVTAADRRTIQRSFPVATVEGLRKSAPSTTWMVADFIVDRGRWPAWDRVLTVSDPEGVGFWALRLRNTSLELLPLCPFPPDPARRGFLVGRAPPDPWDAAAFLRRSLITATSGGSALGTGVAGRCSEPPG
jgi:hypothetical protein